MGKTIGVISLKGGVGKTSSVLGLGSALSDLGKKVLLVDANFSVPNLGIHLNLIDPEKTIHDILDRTAKIRDAIYVFDDKFHVIPGHLFNRKEVNQLDLKNKLSNVKKNYDVILLDSSPAFNEESLATMLASDELLVVTTPDYPTLSTTLKSIGMAKQRGIPISGLILNKVHNKNFELSIDEIERTSGVPVVAVIPHELNILKAVSNFMPSVFHKPNSESSEEFRKLAATLVGEKYNSARFKDFFRLGPKREEVNREIYYKRVFK